MELALNSNKKNPLELAEDIVYLSSIPMLGCEHAWATAGALLSALRNNGYSISDEQIKEAINRTKRQAISAFCGLTGVCGIAPAIGAVFSVILDAACPKDKETATTMLVVSKVIEAISMETGPSCCKNFMRTGLALSSNLIEEYLKISLPLQLIIVCQDSQRHPHGCRESQCRYFAIM